MRRSILALLPAVLTFGCSSSPPRNVEAGAPAITRSQLPDAVVDSQYLAQLQASGGQGACTYGIENVPTEISSWLAIDPATGLLSGTPLQVIDPGLQFSVRVTDSRGESTTTALKLSVYKCLREGEPVACYAPDADAGACMQDSLLCSNKTFGSCDPKATSAKRSQSTAHCGVAAGGNRCGTCPPALADRCDGVCQCGPGPACTGASLCCGGNCVDGSSDPNDCGACGNVCPAGPAGSHPVCLAGQCGYACDGTSVECGGACVDTSKDPNNCGGCASAGGKVCSGATPICSGGGCTADCGSLTNCSGSCVNMNNDVAHCGSCTTVCPAGPANSSPVCAIQNGAPACGWSCNAGYSPCNGACVNTQTDPNNCNGCGVACPAGVPGSLRSCSAGACGTYCPSTKPYCDNTGSCISATLCSGGGDPIDPPPDPPRCFVAGTPITLADGSVKPIEEIAVGDQVLAYDEAAGAFAAGVVSQLFVHPETPALLRVNGTLVTTPEHRFFVNGEWMAAGRMQVGDQLFRADGAGPEPVTSLELVSGPETTYNFEVETFHDYFAGGVLVHNIKYIP